MRFVWWPNTSAVFVTVPWIFEDYVFAFSLLDRVLWLSLNLAPSSGCYTKEIPETETKPFWSAYDQHSKLSSKTLAYPRLNYIFVISFSRKQEVSSRSIRSGGEAFSTSKTTLDGEAGHVSFWPNSATNLPLGELPPHETRRSGQMFSWSILLLKVSDPAHWASGFPSSGS